MEPLSTYDYWSQRREPPMAPWQELYAALAPTEPIISPQAAAQPPFVRDPRFSTGPSLYDGQVAVPPGFQPPATMDYIPNQIPLPEVGGIPDRPLWMAEPQPMLPPNAAMMPQLANQPIDMVPLPAPQDNRALWQEGAQMLPVQAGPVPLLPNQPIDMVPLTAPGAQAAPPVAPVAPEVWQGMAGNAGQLGSAPAPGPAPAQAPLTAPLATQARVDPGRGQMPMELETGPVLPAQVAEMPVPPGAAVPPGPVMPGAYEQEDPFQFDPRAARAQMLLQAGAGMLSGADLQQGLARLGAGLSDAATQERANQMQEYRMEEAARREGYEDEWRQYTALTRERETELNRQEREADRAAQLEDKMYRRAQENAAYRGLLDAHGAAGVADMTPEQLAREATRVTELQKDDWQHGGGGNFWRIGPNGVLEHKSLWEETRGQLSAPGMLTLQSRIQNEIQQFEGKESRKLGLDSAYDELSTLRRQSVQTSVSEKKIAQLEAFIEEKEAELAETVQKKSAELTRVFSTFATPAGTAAPAPGATTPPPGGGNPAMGGGA